MSPKVLFKYLAIQAIFMLWGLLFTIHWMGGVLIPLFLKMGIPPMHLWLLLLIPYLDLKGFLFMVSVHKTLPIMASSKLLSQSMFQPILLLMVLSSLLLLLQATLFLVLLFSSLMQSCLTLASNLINTWFMTLYWVTYASMTWMVLLSLLRIEMPAFAQSLSLGVGILALSGLPPLVIFWFKVAIFYWALNISQVLSYFIMLSSFMALVAYLRGYYSTNSSVSLRGTSWLRTLWMTPLIVMGSLLLY